MSGKLSSILWRILLAAIFTACSVKEDRTACPCLLILDFDNVNRNNLDSLEISVLDVDNIICRDVVHEECYGEEYRLSVPKGRMRLNVYSFMKGGPCGVLENNGAGLIIPPGNECPPVYMHSALIETNKEIHREEVVPKKNFCRVFINMVSEGDARFGLELDGNVCGYGRDGCPAEGRFSCVPREDADGRCEARIPRQTDNSLRLRISDGDGILRDFALGEYIIAGGYDWTAEELEDVEVEINYASTHVTFIVNDWEATVSFEVII